MNRLLLSVLSVLVVVAAGPAWANTVGGVLVEERIVNLPQDQGKWYVSVVGKAADTRYNELVGWFDTNASLKKLKNQVHFCPVTPAHRLYQERYGANVKGLPTVRVQKPSGEVVYEAAANRLPMTADGLYAAIATGVQTTQGLRPLLPWRRDMEQRCVPQPQPQPQPQPDPSPLPDDGGAPEMDPVPVVQQVQWVWFSVLCVLGLIGGLVASYGRQFYKKLHPMVK